MPAHLPARTIEDELAKLSRVLVALCRKEGGEIRIRAADIDGLNEQVVLGYDWDPATGEIVLQVRSQFAEFIKVAPEANQWVRPLNERKEVLNQEPARTSVLTDAQVAQIEEGLRKRAAARRATNEATERSSTIKTVS